MRAPDASIAAPAFPAALQWLNLPARSGVAGGAPVSVIQRGRPLLVEFWDFCRPNSIRTLPYVKAWHERYGEHGLRVVGVHSPGFEPSREPAAVRAAVERLGVAYPVAIDSQMLVWQEYENAGWPARYLFDGGARLFEYHFGEGAYEETELAIQELVGVSREPLAPLRAEDAPGALLAPQTEDRLGAYCGAYEAGGVWAVLAGRGSVTMRALLETDTGPERLERDLAVEHPGAYPLLEHDRHTRGVFEIALRGRVECLATCFTPGLA